MLEEPVPVPDELGYELLPVSDELLPGDVEGDELVPLVPAAGLVELPVALFRAGVESEPCEDDPLLSHAARDRAAKVAAMAISLFLMASLQLIIRTE